MVTVPRSALAKAVAGIPRVAPLPNIAGITGGAARRAPQVLGSYDPGFDDDQGFFKNLLTGPVGQALSTIDLGRSAVVSTAKEGIDLLQGEGFSGSDWVNQVKTHYGFGDILRDENIDLGKWGNRAVGFIGDVALDPLTYATLGSATLAKATAREVADQLVAAGNREAAKRVIKSGSKLAAGGKALRSVGYDVGLSMSMPGTGMFGRAVRMDRALNDITGGAISRRRAAQWAPWFQTTGAKYGMSAKQSQELFAKAVGSSRTQARQLLDDEARALAGRHAGKTGTAYTADLVSEISDDLFALSNRARTSRVDLFWRNGTASTRGPEWARVTQGLSGDTVRGTAGGVGGFATRGGDNVVIRMAASAPGRVLQSALRSRIGKGLSKGLDQKAKRTKFMLDALDSGDALSYQAARVVEDGVTKGHANNGLFAEAVDRLQSRMLNAAFQGGFDISGAAPGPISGRVTMGMGERAKASAILLDAMDEPWTYADGTFNENLRPFIDHVEQFRRVDTVQPEKLHEELRKFWDEMGETWETLTGRKIDTSDLTPDERYVTRRMTPEAREAAKNEGWYKAMKKSADAMGERLDPDAAAGSGKRDVRDVAYSQKERAFKAGGTFTWKGKKLEILTPGAATAAGGRRGGAAARALDTEDVPIGFFDDMQGNPGVMAGEATDQAKVDKLAASIAKDGIQEPLILELHPETGLVWLGEGNHRLAAARQLGLDSVPVRGMRHEGTPRGVRLSGRGKRLRPHTLVDLDNDDWFGEAWVSESGERLQATFSPSQVGVPIATIRGVAAAGTRAPSVRRQIIDFLREVDPEIADNFFVSDTAKLIDTYKVAQGREILWASIESNLAKHGIFVEAADLRAYNGVMNDMEKGAKGMRAQAGKLGVKAEAKRVHSQEAAARAKGKWDESRQLTDDASDAATRANATAEADLNALDPRIAQVQRAILNLTDEIDGKLRDAATKRFRTAPDVADAQRDLFDMSVALESTTRLARMLNTVADGIMDRAQMAGLSDLSGPAEHHMTRKAAYADILRQLELAKDLIGIAQRKAGQLGALDRTVQDVQDLVDGLLGKSRGGLGRKDAGPKYIQNYVDQVDEIRRLGVELDAEITFNAGWRAPTDLSDLTNRNWVEKARLRLQQDFTAEVADRAEALKLGADADAVGTTPRGSLIDIEAERLTIEAARREALQEVVNTNRRAREAWIEGSRLAGFDPMGGPVGGGGPYKGASAKFPNYQRNAAEALDLDSQRLAAEAKLLDTEIGQVLETDMGKFQQADNMFRHMIDGRYIDPDTGITALRAGFRDGALPFGPAVDGEQMYMSILGSEEANRRFLEMMRSTLNSGSGTGNEFWKAWDSLTGYFKAQAIARPAFIQRNLLGGVFNNVLAGMQFDNMFIYMKARHRAMKAGWKDALAEAGVEPREWADFQDFLGKRPAELKRRAARLGAEKLAKNPKDAVMRDFARVYRSGAVGAGQASMDVAQSFRLGGATHIDRYGRPIRANMLRRDNVFNTAIRNGNSEAEELLRGMLAFDSVTTGMSDIEAIARVNKFHFNYSKEAQTDFERRVASRAIPFYTWTRNSIPLMATQLGRNPKPFVRYLQLKNNIESGVEKDRNVPDWYGERWGIDLSALLGNPNQGQRTFAFPDLPFMDLINVAKMPSRETPFGPAQHIAEGLAPQLKAPVEYLTGTNIFTQAEIGTDFIPPPRVFDIPGLLPFLSKALPMGMVKKNHRGEWGMREDFAYHLGNFVPYITQMRRLAPKEERFKEDLLLNWLNWISPIGMRERDWRAGRGTAYARQRDRSEDRRRMISLENL
jgi:hypothetical protein